MRIALLSISLLALALAARAGEPEIQEVTITGSGGWKLSAFYAAPRGAAEGKCPAVILTHMLNRQKEDWKPLLGKLTGAGFAVVAYDVRGHGKSVDAAGNKKHWSKFVLADWTAAESDIHAVAEWLLKEKKEVVDEGRVALMGASIGANLSLRALIRGTKLRGAVLLSAGLEYKEVKTAGPAGRLGPEQKLAIFAAREDYGGYCARTAEALAKAAGKDKVIKKRIYDGGEHGTRMFGKTFGVEDEVLDALKKLCTPKDAPAGEDVKNALDRVL